MISDEQLDLWGARIWEKLGHTAEHYNYAKFLENLSFRAQQDRHSVCLLSGEAGEGKSNFSLISGLVLRTFGFDFNFDNHVSYGDENLEQVVEKMTSTKKGVFIFDEGIEAGDSRRFMSKVNSVITTNMTKVRKQNHVFFWNIPDITDLDARIKNRIANYWIHVMYRTNHIDRSSDYSTAGLFRKDRNPFVRDKWGFDVIERQFRNKPVHSSKELRGIFRRLRSHVCFMRTPRMPKVLEDSYRHESEKALAEQGREGAAELSKKPRKKKQRNEEEDEPEE
jgi:hypothetical protein